MINISKNDQENDQTNRINTDDNNLLKQNPSLIEIIENDGHDGQEIKQPVNVTKEDI